MDVRKYIESNRELWDAWTAIHEKSEFYDIEGFLAGKSRLKPVEREELLPEARGKQLLHLQCHFGLDSMSWARECVSVTAVDFSPRAIRLGESLNERAGLDVRFICSDLESLPDQLDEHFDIVFTSYGVLYWLPDTKRWAEISAHFVRPGGIFYMVEFHPFAQMFDNEHDEPGWRVTEPYFHRKAPREYCAETSYADADTRVDLPEYGWAHPIGDVVTALIQAGLQVEYVHEFPFSTYRQFPFLEEHGEWDWRPPKDMGDVPLLYSVKARRPAEEV